MTNDDLTRGAPATTPEEQWYERPLRVAQTILRTMDAPGYSAEAYVEHAVRTGANTVCINAGGLYAYYPTRIGGHPTPEGLDRDVVGDVVRVAHEAGLRVLGRVDFRAAAASTYARQPQWFAHHHDGSPRTAHGLHTAAATSPYRAEAFAFPVVEELLTRYELDGIWENAAGFLHSSGEGPVHPGPQLDVLADGAAAASFALVDYGPSTAARFEAETGRALPTPDAFDAEDYLTYMEWRYGVVRARMVAMRALVKRFGQHLAYVAEAPPLLDVGWSRASAQDVADLADTWDILTAPTFDLTRESYGSELLPVPVWRSEEVATYLRATRRSTTPTIMFGRFDNQSRYSTVAPEELRVWLAGAAAHGAGLWECTFVGSHEEVFPDRRCSGVVQEGFSRVEELGDLATGVEQLADVAVVHSRRTQDALGGARPGDDHYVLHVRGVLKALQGAHVPFDILPDSDLTAVALQRYRVVVLPNTVVLDDDQCATLRDYVAGGGGLVATAETSLRASATAPARRSVHGLADVLGVRSHEGSTGDLVHAFGRIHQRGPLTAGLEDTDMVTTQGVVQRVRPTSTASAVVALVERIAPQPPEHGWVGPAPSADPLVLCNDYQRGRSVYFAGATDRHCASSGHPDHGLLLTNAVRWAAGDEPELLVTDAPPSVHVSVLHRPADRQLVVHLVNYTSGPGRPIRQLVPCRDISVSLLCRQGRVRRVSDPLSGEELDHVVDDGRVVLRFAELELHAVRLVELER